MRYLINNLLYLIKIIPNYGYVRFALSIIFEFYYIFRLKNFDIFNFSKKNQYLFKSKQKYSTNNIPTPFYILFNVKNFFFKKKINNFFMIDLGCGSGRVLKYFNLYFKCRYLGLDFNKKLINKNIKENNLKNIKYIYFNLRAFKKLKYLIKSENKNNKKIVFFISDSFDAFLIKKILIYMKKNNFSLKLIMINQINLKIFSKYKKIYYKEFNNKFLRKKTKKKDIKNLTILNI